MSAILPIVFWSKQILIGIFKIYGNIVLLKNFNFVLSSLLFYTLVYPLSILPLAFIYVISDVFYALLLTIFPYRRKVIYQNLKKAFPEYNERQLKALVKEYYRYLADLLAEGIKNLSISLQELTQRVQVVNPEIMEEFYAKGKSVILAGGHYCNWEWLITSQQQLFPHQAIGIGKPLSNGFWDKKLNALRARYGMIIAHSKNFKEIIHQNQHRPVALLTLTDQAPKDPKKSYWMSFLHQETPVLFGAEMMAHTYDFAVVYFTMKKVKRGYYKIVLQTITDNPSNMSWGEITEAHTKLLEQDIIAAPAYWLWSHKRWKREIPWDIESLQKEQKASFDRKFKIKVS